jgi:hypothetical protein
MSNEMKGYVRNPGRISDRATFLRHSELVEESLLQFDDEKRFLDKLGMTVLRCAPNSCLPE